VFVVWEHTANPLVIGGARSAVNQRDRELAAARPVPADRAPLASCVRFVHIHSPLVISLGNR
jgi:hypothetical protein